MLRSVTTFLPVCCSKASRATRATDPPRVAACACSSEAFEVLERLLNAKFRVLHLMDTIGSHLCEPTFEGFGFLGWNGLDDAEKSLYVNAFGVMSFAIGRDELVGGTNCPPLALSFQCNIMQKYIM